MSPSHSHRTAAISLLVGGLAWELIARTAEFRFFPPLSTVLLRAFELIADGTILPLLVASLTNLVIGFGISAVVGVVIGVLMGRFWRVDAALDAYVLILLTSPTLVFAPVFFAIFGFSRSLPIAIIIIETIPIIIVNARGGVRAVRRDYIEMARSFDAREMDLSRLVILPAAMPYIMSGIQLGAGRAVKGMVIGEMFIAVFGLGGIIISAGRVFDAVTVLAVLMVVIILSMVLTSIVDRIDRRLTRWLPSVARP